MGHILTPFIARCNFSLTTKIYHLLYNILLLFNRLLFSYFVYQAYAFLVQGSCQVATVQQDKKSLKITTPQIQHQQSFYKDHQKKLVNLEFNDKKYDKINNKLFNTQAIYIKTQQNQFTNNSIKKYMLKSLNNLFFSKKSKMSQNYKEEIQHVNIQMCQSTGGAKLIRWQDGTVYIGEWVGQAMNGVGKLRYPSGDYYEGQFKDNNFHGAGKYFGQNGIYEGQWENGLKSGFGKQKNLDGSSFVGTYDKGLKSGIGLFEWIDGSFYQGMFQQDRMEGPGKMIYSDGSKVEGEWKQNQIHGVGRQTDKEGNIYIGPFRKGLKNGNGILIQKFHKIEGIWVKGQLKCAILIESNDGRAFCGKYEENNFIKISDESFQELRDKLNQQELILSE